jgi:hypothetical protein
MAATLLIFDPRSATPKGDAQLELANDRPVLAFDGASNETAVFESVVPQGYAAGTVDAKIFYIMSTATSGDIDWDVEVEAVTDGDAFDLDASDGFATTNAGTTTAVPGTAGHLDVVTVTLTNDDGLAAGDYIRFRLTRDVVTGGGTPATGDARLTKLEIREQ